MIEETIIKYLSQAVILQMPDHMSRPVQSAYHTNRIRSLYDLPCLISPRRSRRRTDRLSVSPFLISIMKCIFHIENSEEGNRCSELSLLLLF